MQQYCTICQQAFECQVQQIDSCWCNQYPGILSADANTSCICEACLKTKILDKINKICELDYGDLDGATKRWIKGLPKTTKLLPDIDYTIENGVYVFSKWYHFKRGYCCGNGCRNCAF